MSPSLNWNLPPHPESGGLFHFYSSDLLSPFKPYFQKTSHILTDVKLIHLKGGKILDTTGQVLYPGNKLFPFCQLL